MDFRLYAARRAWLIVPDCMQASQAAVERYGQLEPVGEFPSDMLDAAERARIVADFDRDSFAVVDEGIARRLLRSRAPTPA